MLLKNGYNWTLIIRRNCWNVAYTRLSSKNTVGKWTFPWRRLLRTWKRLSWDSETVQFTSLNICRTLAILCVLFRCTKHQYCPYIFSRTGYYRCRRIRCVYGASKTALCCLPRQQNCNLSRQCPTSRCNSGSSNTAIIASRPYGTWKMKFLWKKWFCPKENTFYPPTTYKTCPSSCQPHKPFCGQKTA